MNVTGRLEGAVVAAVLRAFGGLPAAAASNVAGGIAAVLGPFLPVSRVAERNLCAALPELDAAERARVVRDSWSQLGRTAGEFAHLGRLPHNSAAGAGWQVQGEAVLAQLSARGGPAVFFSGHIGNWEILPLAARLHGLPIASFYRAAQNPHVNALMQATRGRTEGGAPKLFAKGRDGARQAVAHLRAGGRLAMLVDQKLNDGIASDLFGMLAMTAPSAASFALHFRCPLVPVVVRRTGPARLLVCVEKPLAHPDTGDRVADVAALTRTVNATLERWIREEPSSWLWLHRRWSDQVISDKIAAMQRNKLHDLCGTAV